MNEDEPPNFFDHFSETDLHDFDETLLDVIGDVWETELLRQSNPNPLPFFIQIFTDYVCQDWIYSDACTEGNYEDIYEYIEEFFVQFLETMEHEFPPRQSIDTHPQTMSPQKRELIVQKINTLQQKYQPAQRSDAWYEYRHNLITASNIYKTLGSESQRNSIIYEKCKPFTAIKVNYFSQDPRQWGTVYEPLSIMIYENLYGTRVADFGCIQHDTYACIGASPDGINVDPASERFGRMIEVKNIVNREITTVPKEEYWIQMQVQMETCDLDECDFIETRFKAFETDEAFYEDTSDHQKGVYLCFVEQNKPTDGSKIIYLNNNNDTQTPPKFVYMPLDVACHPEDVDRWINQQKQALRPDYILHSTHYWYLDEFSCILVKRNRLWFQAALPKILETWDIIEQERKTGYEHRAAKKRATAAGNIVLESAPSIMKADPSIMKIFV